MAVKFLLLTYTRHSLCELSDLIELVLDDILFLNRQSDLVELVIDYILVCK